MLRRIRRQLPDTSISCYTDALSWLVACVVRFLLYETAAVFDTVKTDYMAVLKNFTNP
jgi:hypothetical protein